MRVATDIENTSWLDSIKPYMEKEALIALLLGISSGFPYAMIGATLSTRLAQDGIDKKAVTAFALAFLVYNFKWAWAWIVDGVSWDGDGAIHYNFNLAGSDVPYPPEIRVIPRPGSARLVR